jgi:hypothetical protein
MTPKLESYSAEELKELPYSTLLRLRSDAYKRHVASMTVPDELVGWARKMALRYGPKVQIWQNELPWLEALMVARYGEEPSSWPTAFSPDDVDRALAWMRNKKVGTMKGRAPAGLQYLDLEGGFARVKALIGLVLIFVGAHVAQLLASLAVVLVAGAGFASGVLHPLEATVLVGTALSNFWENELIDHLFRARSYTAPTDIYFALYTAAPGETGGGTEVSGGSYARVQVATGFANFEGTGGETTATDSAGTGGGTQNRNAITFPAPTANWGVASHFAGLSASSVGDFFFYGALTTPKTINNGDPAPSFAAGDFDFSLA